MSTNSSKKLTFPNRSDEAVKASPEKHETIPRLRLFLLFLPRDGIVVTALIRNLVRAATRRRVITALMPGTALQKTPQRHPHPPEKTPFLKDEDGVLGTGWIKTAAVAQKGRYQTLVSSDQKNGHGCGRIEPSTETLPEAPLRPRPIREHAEHTEKRASPSSTRPIRRPKVHAAAAPWPYHAKRQRQKRPAPGPSGTRRA